MNHLGLFEGIGGFSLAARWMGWNTLAWVEKNKFCQKVLAKNFPYAKGYEDIKDFNGKEWKNKIQIITGGFPCQPFSLAGVRKGEDDERYLWDENFRIICEVQPIAFIGENVSGLVSMGNGQTLEKICLDLESQNYKVQSFIIPACAVQAWHRRDRIWIVAYLDQSAKGQDGNSNGFGSEETTSLQAKKQGRNGKKFQRKGCNNLQSGNGFPSDLDQIGCGKMVLQREQAEREMFGSISEAGEIIIGNRSIKPVIRRNLHGLSSKLDGSLTNSNKRKAALGNAIVPQVAFQIYKSLNLLINSPC